MKVWTRTEIDQILKAKDRAVERAVVLLYLRQTTVERTANQALIHNRVGFSANVASLGSGLARIVLAGKPLRELNLRNARIIALRHSKQLVEIANANERAKIVQELPLSF